jgi:hypothetical protein
MAFACSALSLILAIESLASSECLLASLVSFVAFSLSVGAFSASIFAFAAVQFQVWPHQPEFQIFFKL